MDGGIKVAVAVLLSLSLSSLVAAQMAAAECGWPARWLDYDGNPHTLSCSESRNSWWQRNTNLHGDLTDCLNLQEAEWIPAEACSGQYCDARANATTFSLEYCCTAGANPAAVSASERDCFTLSVCPLVTDAHVVPTQLLAGHQASLYLSLFSHPASFPSPQFLHTRIGHFPLQLETHRTIHSQFINVTAAYTFTVPAEGRVDISLSFVSPPEGSGCGTSLVSGQYPTEFKLPIENSGAPTPPPQCSCSSPQPPSQATATATATATTTHGTTHTSSSALSASPSASPEAPHSPSSPSSPTWIPSSSALETTPPPNKVTCQQKTNNDGRGIIMWLLIALLVVMTTVLGSVAVAMGLWVCRLKRRMRQFVSSGSIKSASDRSLIVEANEMKPVLSDGVSPAVVSSPSSPAPPLPTTSPPSLPPKHQTHHHVISSIHEGSVDSGTIVSTPPPSHETVLYSIPFQKENGASPRSSHAGDTKVPRVTPSPHHQAHSSPQHSISTVSSLTDLTDHFRVGSNDGVESGNYRFIGGRIFREGAQVDYLHPGLNGPIRKV